jgi:hypothetical protein
VRAVVSGGAWCGEWRRFAAVANSSRGSSSSNSHQLPGVMVDADHSTVKLIGSLPSTITHPLNEGMLGVSHSPLREKRTACAQIHCDALR